MVTSHFSEKKLTPSDMNKWLKKNKGYEKGWEGDQYLGEVSLNWPALAEFEGGWVYSRFDRKALPADLLLIEYYLSGGVPVIAEVLYNNAYNISDVWGSGPSRNIYGIRVLFPASRALQP